MGNHLVGANVRFVPLYWMAFVAIGLVLLGCGKNAPDYEKLDKEFLSGLEPAPLLQSTLKEEMRQKYEFHTMLVPENWKSSGGAISLHNEVELKLIPKPGRCHELRSVIDRILKSVGDGKAFSAPRRAFIAGREGVMLSTTTTDSVTKKSEVTRLYVANLNYDVSHDEMLTTVVRVQMGEENVPDVAPLVDEIVNSIVSTF